MYSIDITTEQSFRHKNMNFQKCIIILGFCKLGHIYQSLHSIPYVRKFWSGKILANKLTHQPILPAKRLLFSISLNYTYSLFTNILHSNWFRLLHSSMLYPTKFSHVRYVHACNTMHAYIQSIPYSINFWWRKASENFLW